MKLDVIPHQADNVDPERIVVVKKHPVFETFQGEGIYTGMSSLFVRLYGCNDTCSFCDSKHTWKTPQKGAGEVISTQALASMVSRSRLQHIVLTGGEPSLQAEGLCNMIASVLDMGGRDRLYTLETNGSNFNERLSDAIGLVSLSPKIHHFGNGDVQDNIMYWLHHSKSIQRPAQMKIVVEEEGDVDIAIAYMRSFIQQGLLEKEQAIIQPEWQRWGTNAKPFTEKVIDAGLRWLPQAHKTWGVL